MAHTDRPFAIRKRNRLFQLGEQARSAGCWGGVMNGHIGRFGEAIALAFCLQLVLSSPSMAQNMLRGTVVDGNGNPLNDAKIILVDLGQGLRIETTSRDGGRFSRAGIPSGRYRLSCELKSYQFNPIEIEIGTTAKNTVAIRMVKSRSLKYEAGFEAFSKGRYADAVATMQQVLVEDPGDMGARFVLGASLMETGKLDEALSSLRQVESSGGELATSPTLLVTLGRTYLLMGDTQNAEKYFGKVTNPEAVGAAFADVGIRAFNAGGFKEARTFFERALHANPEDPDALYGLALCLIEANEIEQAVQRLKTLVATSPTHPNAKRAADLLKQLKK